MAAQIVINQSGFPSGVAGQAREDLALGIVSVAVTGGPYAQVLWTILDKPINWQSPPLVPLLSSAYVANANIVSTTIEGVDQEGTYLIQCLVDAGFGLGGRPEDIIRTTFYAGGTGNNLSIDPAALPRRVPAFGERLEHNVPDLVLPAGYNSRGWAQEMDRWFAFLRSRGSGGGGLPDRYTPIDSNTIIQWKLDEVSPPYANSGTGGPLDLVPVYSTVFPYPAPFSCSDGIFGRCLGFQDNVLGTVPTSINPDGNAMTVSFWAMLQTTAPVNPIAFMKRYRADGTWNPPFVAFAAEINANTTDSRIDLTTGGSLAGQSHSRVFTLSTGIWHHLAFTYDSSTLLSYIDGTLVGSLGYASAPCDFGGDGRYELGGLGGVGQFFTGKMYDVRVENGIRSGDYLAALYRKAMIFPTLPPIPMLPM